MAEEKKNLTEEEIDDTEEEAGASGSDDKGTDDKDSGGKSSGGSGKPAGKTFTQEQVTKISTREKNQGRAAAYKEMGIDPKDTKTMNMVKAFLESQKSDDQKAAEKQAADQNARVEAEQRAVIAEAKAEAMMQGVKPQYVDDIVTLALAKMTEDSDLKTVIGEFKTKYPVWFGESDDKDDDKDDKGKGKTGQRGTGSSVKTDKEKKGDDKGAKGLGARLAAQRKSGNKKSSYWGKN